MSQLLLIECARGIVYKDIVARMMLCLVPDVHVCVVLHVIRSFLPDYIISTHTHKVGVRPINSFLTLLRGTIVNRTKMLLVKICKCVGFCVHHRSY